jgi:hypothetical protein
VIRTRELRKLTIKELQEVFSSSRKYTWTGQIKKKFAEMILFQKVMGAGKEMGI